MAELPEINSPTVTAIYNAIEAMPQDKERLYLGASSIGNECERALWYGFRWAHAPQKHDGRMLRLFNTGHKEEARLIKDLIRAGISVDGYDGEQIAVSAVNGHFRGHLDGVAHGVPEAPKTVHVLECKTHNDKSFKALKKDKVEKAKPVHYAQMQIYMHLMGITRALYLAVNKNDDELYAERVRYDAAYSLSLIAKAERIIKAEKPPQKLHDDPDAKIAFACRYCPALGVCHKNEFAKRNCRTCLHSTPSMVGDGEWTCARFSKSITPEEQRAGCGYHLYLPDLVPGEQVDANEQEEWVSYVLHDGTEWVDDALAIENAGEIIEELIP